MHRIQVPQHQNSGSAAPTELRLEHVSVTVLPGNPFRISPEAAYGAAGEVHHPVDRCTVITWAFDTCPIRDHCSDRFGVKREL